MSENKETGKYPPEFMAALKAVKAKRARAIIDYLLEHGSVTTWEIESVLGYTHAPRAIRDVREQGIPIERESIRVDGKTIAQYKFGDPSKMNPASKKSGRSAFAKEVKEKLLAKYGAVDFIYLEEAKPAELQIDHRIPYEIGGDGDESEGIDRYMLLTNSANRLKSHACENCPNWTKKDPGMCCTCFWAYPENYEHVAGRQERLMMFVLRTDEQIRAWDKLREVKGEVEARKIVAKAMIEKSNKM